MEGRHPVVGDLVRLGVRLIVAAGFGLAILALVTWQRRAAGPEDETDGQEARAARRTCGVSFHPRVVARGAEGVRLVAVHDEPLRAPRRTVVAENSGLSVEDVRPQSGRRTSLLLDARHAVTGGWAVDLTDGERSCAGMLSVVDTAPGRTG